MLLLQLVSTLLCQRLASDERALILQLTLPLLIDQALLILVRQAGLAQVLLARFHPFVLRMGALLGEASLRLSRIALLRFTPLCFGTLTGLGLGPGRNIGATR
jgi:hypothetical protein